MPYSLFLRLDCVAWADDDTSSIHSTTSSLPSYSPALELLCLGRYESCGVVIRRYLTLVPLPIRDPFWFAGMEGPAKMTE